VAAAVALFFVALGGMTLAAHFLLAHAVAGTVK
jgi:hypothetical protein